MSEGFEYIDASSIDVPVRKRKPKYKHKLWEAESPKDYDRYLLAASRINQRRQILLTGEYDVEMDPHAARITERNRYEIECETVFHSDIDSIDLEINDENTMTYQEFVDAFGIIWDRAYSLDDDEEFSNEETVELVKEATHLLSIGYALSKEVVDDEQRIGLYDYTMDLMTIITEFGG